MLSPAHFLLFEAVSARSHPPDSAASLFGLGFVAVTFVLALGFGLHRQRKARANLEGLAQRLGLELKTKPAFFGFQSGMAVEGIHRQRVVRFFNYTTGSGKSRTTWSAVATTAGGAGKFTLSLSSENLLTRIGTVFGQQDIKVGDTAFDQAFVVKSSDPAYAAAALLPEIRARLLAERQRGAHGHLTIANGQVRYAEIGAFNSPARTNRLAEMLDVVCDLAETADVYAA